MNFFEQVAKWIGVELNKQFQVYDMEGNHVAAAVFKLDRSGCHLQVIPEDDACIGSDTVLCGLVCGNLVPKTKRLDDCPFCGGQNALVQRMRFTGEGQIQIMYTVYCPDCQAHGPLAESEDEAADGWNE